ncbi:hypothetical protein [Arthrobacter mobilis]|uniref:Uncharacterized protein n=1 Tax=Arthrobacter mobilis TaxID=2724944 RepID=A0A7X6HDS7_9MICC|nr:hypothetical protein [Arthrobacter mobilis]NKX55273.1 hypothetical protein [Arthrobacter mobilis]
MSLTDYGQLGLSAVLAAGLVALTAWAIGTALRRQERLDAVFWYGFAGLCCVAAVVLIAAVAYPAAAPALILLVLACSLPAVLHVSRRWSETSPSGRHRAWQELTSRHDAALARWARYELDPAGHLEAPAITDVRRAETAAMIRAMRHAAQLRQAAPGPRGLGAVHRGGAAELAAYSRAVAEFERCLVAAEQAAGRGRSDS